MRRLALALAACFCASAQSKLPVVASTRLVVHVEIENPVAKVNSPVFLQLLFKNVSAQPLQVFTPWTEATFEILIVDQAGKAVPLTAEGVRYLDPSTLLRNFWADLPAGHPEWATMEITRLFQLTQPGTYSLHASRIAIPGTLPQQKPTYEWGYSNVVTFTITPADSPLLRTGPDKGIRSKAAMFPGEVPTPFQISADPANISISAGEPVIAGIIVRNNSLSAQTLEINLNTEDSYRVGVTRPDGKRVDAFVPHGGVSNGVTYRPTIAPGQTYVRNTVLSRWFSFDQPGLYSVAMFIPDADAPAMLQVNVEPRDPARLERVCADLAKRADSPFEPFAAYTALSVTRDPIAVRQLRRYAGNDFGMQALTAIGTVDAVAVLAEVAHGGDAKLSQRAKDNLKRIRSTTQDQAVREAIDSALGAN